MTQAPLSVPCPRCAAALPIGANFCRRCGIGLTRPPLPPSVRYGPLTNPPTRRAKPTRDNAGIPLLPVLLICVFALNAMRAYQRNAVRHVQPSPALRMPPRPFGAPTPLFSPAPVAAPVPAAPLPATLPGGQPSSVDELHWSGTPRWSVHSPDSTGGSPWYPPAARDRASGRDH